jgi:hypothetical protein
MNGLLEMIEAFAAPISAIPLRMKYANPSSLDAAFVSAAISG